MSAQKPREESPVTVSLADEEAVKHILVSTVFGLWDIVKNLTRLRPTRREWYRVMIFGSARARPGTYVYDEVKRLAAALAEMGCDIITGGGTGLMSAADKCADTAHALERSRSVETCVDTPYEQEANPFVEHVFERRTSVARLHHFVLTACGFVAAQGALARCSTS
jgi:predicted Rossmann-fold nucleotide-binding protein